MSPGDRVYIKPLEVNGTVAYVREDGRVVVLADCATQPVVWLAKELEARS